MGVDYNSDYEYLDKFIYPYFAYGLIPFYFSATFFVICDLISPKKPQQYKSSPMQVQFRSNDIPRDDSVIGMMHSHTLGPAIPSDQDQKTFRLFKINMIISLPNRSLKLFDNVGRGLSYEIVDIQDLDEGLKSVIKLSEILGVKEEKRRRDASRSMYT